MSNEARDAIIEAITQIEKVRKHKFENYDSNWSSNAIVAYCFSAATLELNRVHTDLHALLTRYQELTYNYEIINKK